MGNSVGGHNTFTQPAPLEQPIAAKEDKMKTLLGHLLLILAIAFTPGCGDTDETISRGISVKPEATKVGNVHVSSVSLHAELKRDSITGKMAYPDTHVRVKGRVTGIIHWDSFIINGRTSYRRTIEITLNDSYPVWCRLGKDTKPSEVPPPLRTTKTLEGKIDSLNIHRGYLSDCRILW